MKEDLTAEEAFETQKRKIAELGNALLMDPESNIRSLKEFLQICKDNDPTVVKLGLLSLLAVFKDIIPGYYICRNYWMYGDDIFLSLLQFYC